MDHRKADEAFFTHLVQKLGLQDRLNYLPNQLSGGQQWVSIGPALITRSTILLADEPISNLDSTNSTEIMELFTQFHREEDQTLVLITHDSFIVAQAQRILQIRDGTIFQDEVLEL